MVGLMIHVHVMPSKRHEFMQTFELLGCNSESQVECIYHKLFEETEKPNRFLWMEEWAGSESLEAYMKQDSFRMLLGALEVLGEVETPRILKLAPFGEEERS